MTDNLSSPLSSAQYLTASAEASQCIMSHPYTGGFSYPMHRRDYSLNDESNMGRQGSHVHFAT